MTTATPTNGMVTPKAAPWRLWLLLGLLALLLLYAVGVSAFGVLLWRDRDRLEQVRLTAVGQCVEHHRREFNIAVWPPEEMDYQIARCEVILDAAGGVEYPQQQPFSGAGTAGQ